MNDRDIYGSPEGPRYRTWNTAPDRSGYYFAIDGTGNFEIIEVRAYAGIVMVASGNDTISLAAYAEMTSAERWQGPIGPLPETNSSGKVTGQFSLEEAASMCEILNAVRPHLRHLPAQVTWKDGRHVFEETDCNPRWNSTTNKVLIDLRAGVYEDDPEVVLGFSSRDEINRAIHGLCRARDMLVCRNEGLQNDSRSSPR